MQGSVKPGCWTNLTDSSHQHKVRMSWSPLDSTRTRGSPHVCIIMPYIPPGGKAKKTSFIHSFIPQISVEQPTWWLGVREEPLLFYFSSFPCYLFCCFLCMLLYLHFWDSGSSFPQLRGIVLNVLIKKQKKKMWKYEIGEPPLVLFVELDKRRRGIIWVFLSLGFMVSCPNGHLVNVQYDNAEMWGDKVVGASVKGHCWVLRPSGPDLVRAPPNTWAKNCDPLILHIMDQSQRDWVTCPRSGAKIETLAPYCNWIHCAPPLWFQ